MTTDAQQAPSLHMSVLLDGFVLRAPPVSVGGD